MKRVPKAPDRRIVSQNLPEDGLLVLPECLQAELNLPLHFREKLVKFAAPFLQEALEILNRRHSMGNRPESHGQEREIPHNPLLDLLVSQHMGPGALVLPCW